LDAEFGLESPHREHGQVSLLTVGIFIPAAAKLKPFTGGAGGAITGLGIDAGGWAAVEADELLGEGVSHVSH